MGLKIRHLLLLLKAVAVLATFLSCFVASFILLDRVYKRPVEATSAPFMPVLVLTPGHVEVIPYPSVNTYVEAHPGSSFLIPDDQVVALGEQLRVWRRDGVMRTFRVETLSPGRQYIEVECFGDGNWAGWYEATDKAILPRYAKLYGPGFIFLVIPLATVFTGSLWFVANRGWQAVRRNIPKAAPT